MRINVYAEELTDETELMTKIANVNGREITFYGVRVYLASPGELHSHPGDDDRSAITFWVPWTVEGGHDFVKVRKALYDMADRISGAIGAESVNRTHERNLDNIGA